MRKKSRSLENLSRTCVDKPDEHGRKLLTRVAEASNIQIRVHSRKFAAQFF